MTTPDSASEDGSVDSHVLVANPTRRGWSVELKTLIAADVTKGAWEKACKIEVPGKLLPNHRHGIRPAAMGGEVVAKENKLDAYGGPALMIYFHRLVYKDSTKMSLEIPTGVTFSFDALQGKVELPDRTDDEMADTKAIFGSNDWRRTDVTLDLSDDGDYNFPSIEELKFTYIHTVNGPLEEGLLNYDPAHGLLFMHNANFGWDFHFNKHDFFVIMADVFNFKVDLVIKLYAMLEQIPDFDEKDVMPRAVDFINVIAGAEAEDEDMKEAAGQYSLHHLPDYDAEVATISPKDYRIWQRSCDRFKQTKHLIIWRKVDFISGQKRADSEDLGYHFGGKEPPYFRPDDRMFEWDDALGPTEVDRQSESRSPAPTQPSPPAESPTQAPITTGRRGRARAPPIEDRSEPELDDDLELIETAPSSATARKKSKAAAASTDEPDESEDFASQQDITLWKPGNTEPSGDKLANMVFKRIGNKWRLGRQGFDRFAAIFGPLSVGNMPPAHHHLEDIIVCGIAMLIEAGVLSLASAKKYWPQTLNTYGRPHDEREPYGRPAIAVDPIDGVEKHIQMCGRYIFLGSGGLKAALAADPENATPWLNTAVYKTYTTWEDPSANEKKANPALEKHQGKVTSLSLSNVNFVRKLTVYPPYIAAGRVPPAMKKAMKADLKETQHQGIKTALDDMDDQIDDQTFVVPFKGNTSAVPEGKRFTDLWAIDTLEKDDVMYPFDFDSGNFVLFSRNLFTGYANARKAVVKVKREGTQRQTSAAAAAAQRTPETARPRSQRPADSPNQSSRNRPTPVDPAQTESHTSPRVPLAATATPQVQSPPPPQAAKATPNPTSSSAQTQNAAQAEQVSAQQPPAASTKPPGNAYMVRRVNEIATDALTAASNLELAAQTAFKTARDSAVAANYIIAQAANRIEDLASRDRTGFEIPVNLTNQQHPMYLSGPVRDEYILMRKPLQVHSTTATAYNRTIFDHLSSSMASLIPARDPPTFGRPSGSVIGGYHKFNAAISKVAAAAATSGVALTSGPTVDAASAPTIERSAIDPTTTIFIEEVEAPATAMDNVSDDLKKVIAMYQDKSTPDFDLTVKDNLAALSTKDQIKFVNTLGFNKGADLKNERVVNALFQNPAKLKLPEYLVRLTAIANMTTKQLEAYCSTQQRAVFSPVVNPNGTLLRATFGKFGSLPFCNGKGYSSVTNEDLKIADEADLLFKAHDARPGPVQRLAGSEVETETETTTTSTETASPSRNLKRKRIHQNDQNSESPAVKRRVGSRSSNRIAIKNGAASNDASTTKVAKASAGDAEVVAEDDERREVWRMTLR
ncbi:hypothetical protein LTR56_009947 [Elasticomyces elasticus]|nr:hypothetical protein LTR56_009947 [Elasticomyces elasticus]KAK3656205.1 hypothetical protein LTR22_009912 [Elasticomyces elasticus]KAK4933734.1 hypothetical protein LTR49_000200 [Elasticomyces elasticus]KAK5756550.1 hypothetical protein LTS12_013385 [Elasticomyces elasticus]